MAEYYNDYEFGDEEQEHRRPPRPQFPPDNRFMKDIGRAYLIEECDRHRHHPPRPPYDMETRNRFAPENHFVGDIEDGKRYPFGVYTKEESDERYAVKATEEQVAALQTAVAGKADEQECVDIRARLDALEYKSIVINSFSAAPPVSEIGSSQTITLAWALNKQATSQNINGTPVTGNTKQYIGVTSNQTYTLNVSDGQTSASKSVSVSFANRIYYGAAADLTTVTSLSSVLSNDPERTITVNAGTGEYIIYAIPARIGDVTFFVSGFEGGFEGAVEQTLTNTSGYQETYKVYRSTRAGLGETTIDIEEV
jgi:hypothetical protein